MVTFSGCMLPGLNDEIIGTGPQIWTLNDGLRYVECPNGKYFCLDTQQYADRSRYTFKQKKHFMRLNSGMQSAIARKQRLCFMTLTTQYEGYESGGSYYDREGRLLARDKRLSKIVNLNQAWTLLKQRIERYLQNMMYLKFCRKMGLEPFEVHAFKQHAIKYPEYHDMFKFKLKYFKVKTAEGGGVLHIVFRKDHRVPPIPYKWLSKTWAKIWFGSWDVSIRQIKPRNAGRLAHYVVGQYMAQQPVIRMSYSQQWVYQGFVKQFKKVLDTYGSAWTERAQDGPVRHGMRQPHNQDIGYNRPLGKDGKVLDNWHRVKEIWQKARINKIIPTSATRQRRFGWKAQKPVLTALGHVITWSPYKWGHRRFPDSCYKTITRTINGKTYTYTEINPPTHNEISKPLQTVKTVQCYFPVFSSTFFSNAAKWI